MQGSTLSWPVIVLGGALVALGIVPEPPAPVRAAGVKAPAPGPAASRPTTAPRATLCAIVTDATPHLRELLPAVRAHVTREVRASWVHDDVVEREMRRRPLHEMHPLTAGPKRAAAGTAMLADLLVIFRAGVGSERSVEVAVCEAVHGLTLARETVVLAEDAAKSAAAVAAPIKSAIELRQTGLREIWTVPPFVNKDASADHEHLEAALPELIKPLLRSRPGAVVVEPEEADAVAADFRGGRALVGAAAQRRMPLYFVGALRAAGGVRVRDAAAPVRLSVDLAVGRGSRTAPRAPTSVVNDVPLHELAAAVTDAAAKLVARAAGGTPPVAPAVQRRVELLAARGNAAAAVGDWAGAAALADAALLLRPGDPALHTQAAQAVIGVCKHVYNTGDYTRALRLYRRGLVHFEIFLREGQTSADRQELTTSYRHGPNGLNLHPDAPRGLHDERKRLMLARRDLALRVLRGRIKEKRTDRNENDRHAVQWCVTLASQPVEGEPLAQAYRLLFELADETKGLPDAEKLANRIIRRGYVVQNWEGPEFRAFLKRVAALPSEQVAAAARRVEAELDGRGRGVVFGNNREPRPATRPAQGASPFPSTGPAGAPLALAPAHGPTAVSFHPIQLQPDHDAGATFMRGFGGILPAGKGVDFVWGSGRLYLMKRKGQLSTILKQQEELSGKLEAPCFDGRYVWAPVTRAGKGPLLLVIDPVDGRVAQVTAADGLPVRPVVPRTDFRGHTLHVAPVGPGKVCVAGFTGWGWVAIATWAPDGKTAKVFHEARRAVDPGDKQQRKHLDAVFHPVWMATLTREPGSDADASAERRVLLGRSLGSAGTTSHPLVIDPHKLTVEASEDPRWWPGDPFFLSGLHAGALYGLFPGRQGSLTHQRPDVWRVGFPGLERTILAEQVHDGQAPGMGEKLFFHDGQVFIASRKWWVADGPDKPFRPLQGEPPDRFDAHVVMRRRVKVADLPDEQTEYVHRIVRSEHYGLLAVTGRHKGGPQVYEVRFSGSPARKPADGG